MSKPHDLAGLIKFVVQDDWRDQFADVQNEHIGLAIEELGIDAEELRELLDDVWSSNLWGAAFEDLLTRRFEPGQINIVDDYLKRRGWREKPQVKTYMKAIRDSVMSLYEVSDVVPGKSLRARDLLRGGEPILVSEQSASQTLKQWDRIAARIVAVGPLHILAGGVLPLSLEAATLVQEQMQELLQTLQEPTADFDDEILRSFAPLFSNAWLLDAVPKLMGPEERVFHNNDGEEILFHTLRFAVSGAPARRTVAARLRSVHELESADRYFWNWLTENAPIKAANNNVPNSFALTSVMDDGRAVLGTIELEKNALVLCVNSAERAERGQALLENLLGELVGTPTIEIMNVEDAMARDRDLDEPEAEIAPEVAAGIIHDMMDRHYRATLDQPVAMLGNQSPRAMASSVEGRKKVFEWLKYIENGSTGKRDAAMASYDFSGLWRELGIEDLRR